MNHNATKFTHVETVLLDELAVHLLDLLAHIDQLDSRLDDALRKVAHLSVHLRRVSHVLVQGGLRALLLSASKWNVEERTVVSK